MVRTCGHGVTRKCDAFAAANLVKFSLARAVRACRAHFAFSPVVENNFPAFIPSLPWEHPSPIKFYQRRSSMFVGENLCGSTITAIFILAIYLHVTPRLPRDTVSFSLSLNISSSASAAPAVRFFTFSYNALLESILSRLRGYRSDALFIYRISWPVILLKNLRSLSRLARV